MCLLCLTRASVEVRFNAACDSEMIRYEPGNAMLYPLFLFVDDDIAGGVQYAPGCESSAEISKIVICHIVSRFLTDGFDPLLWEDLVSLCGKEYLRAEIESPLQDNLNSKFGEFWNAFFTYDHFSSQKFWDDLRKPDDVILKHCEEILTSLVEFRDWYYESDMIYAHGEVGFDYKMLGGYSAPICFFALQYICQHSDSDHLLHAFADPDDKRYFSPQYGIYLVFLMKSFELLVKRLGFRSACKRCVRVDLVSFMNVLSLPTTTISDIKEAIDFLKTQHSFYRYEGPRYELELLETLEASYLENKTLYRPFLPPLSSK